MREKHQKHIPLMAALTSLPEAKKMKANNEIINTMPLICDITAGYVKSDVGMTAEQVLRLAIVYRLHDYTYRSLAYNL